MAVIANRFSIEPIFLYYSEMIQARGKITDVWLKLGGVMVLWQFVHILLIAVSGTTTVYRKKIKD